MLTLIPKPKLMSYMGLEHNRDMQGFSLIELIVVMLIMGLLVSIAIPSYNHYIRLNEQLRAQQQGQHIVHQLQQWRARNLTYSGFSLDEQQLQQQLTSHKINYLITLTDATGERLLTENEARTEGWKMLIQPDTESQYFKSASSYYFDSKGLNCVFISPSTVLNIADIESCE